MLKLKLAKDKAVDEAFDTENGTAPANDDNYGTTVPK